MPTNGWTAPDTAPGPCPTALIAVSVNVWLMSGLRLDTAIADWSEAMSKTPPIGSTYRRYPVSGEPPLEGGTHVSTAPCAAAVAVKAIGALGTVGVVTVGGSTRRTLCAWPSRISRRPPTTAVSAGPCSWASEAGPPSPESPGSTSKPTHVRTSPSVPTTRTEVPDTT